MIEPLKILPTESDKHTSKQKNITKAISGDKAAYSNLIIEMENKLYRISRSVLRDDADCADAIQEALIRAWLKLPALRDPALFEHWLSRILLRECYRIAKKTKYYDTPDEGPPYESPDTSQRMDVEEAVYKLKMEQRTPLILHYMMGYKIYEIAEMLSIPEGTVKSRLMHARKKLRSIIKE